MMTMDEGRVEVIQADRDAAAEMWAGLKGEPWQIDWMKDGTADTGPVVQAFARHRIAFTPPSMPARPVEWRTIATAPEDGRLWEVSNDGHVRVDGIARNEHSSAHYRCITMGGKSHRVHRLVAFAFLGEPDPQFQVNHINGIKFDNRVENLEWVTGSENMRHAYRTGLHPGVILRGADSPNFGRLGKLHIQSMAVRATFADGSHRDYESQSMAAADGFRPHKISMCIHGHRKSHHGATWMPLPSPPAA